MAKGNPYKTRRSEIVGLSPELVSRAEPYEVYPFQVRRLSKIEVLSAMDKGQELVSRFVFPGGETLPPVDGQPVIASRSACFLVGTLLVAQCGPSDSRYTDQELFAMLADDAEATEEFVCPQTGDTKVRVLPSLFDQLSDLAAEVGEAPLEAGPRDPLASSPAASSSTPPSPDSDTPVS